MIYFKSSKNKLSFFMCTVDENIYNETKHIQSNIVKKNIK